MQSTAVFLALGLFALAACRGQGSYPSLRPVPDPYPSRPVAAERIAGANDCVFHLQHPSRRFTAMVGFAVSDRHLLVPRGVIDSWRLGEPTVTLRIDGVLTTARIAARGWTDEPDGDWALLEIPGRTFPTFAPIHGPARDPEWAPARGSEVVLVQPASLAAWDGSGWLRPATAYQLRLPRQSRWFVLGGSTPTRAVLGAPVMVWSESASRLEVIGTVARVGDWSEELPTSRRVGDTVETTWEDRCTATSYGIERLPARALDVQGG